MNEIKTSVHLDSKEVIAVSQNEMGQFGCPHCGYRSGSTYIQTGGTSLWLCGGCKRKTVILAAGVTKSSIGIGDFYPELQSHPRRGILSHGRPDNRPENGGEYFHSRGLGIDLTPGCFVCGGQKGMHDNIAAFVQCKAAGERVVGMFPQGARLDYREFEPDRVQVKIGACKEHVSNLTKLSQMTSTKGVITQDIIRECME